MFFFETGVERQLNSITESEANKNFEISCTICCMRGYNIRCEACAIASANQQQKAAILDARKIERKRKIKRKEEQEKIEKLVETAKKIYIQVQCTSDLEKYEKELEKIAEDFLKIKGGGVKNEV